MVLTKLFNRSIAIASILLLLVSCSNEDTIPNTDISSSEISTVESFSEIDLETYKYLANKCYDLTWKLDIVFVDDNVVEYHDPQTGEFAGMNYDYNYGLASKSSETLPILSEKEVQNLAEQCILGYIELDKYTLDETIRPEDSNDDYYFSYSYHKIPSISSMDKIDVCVTEFGEIKYFKFFNISAFDNIEIPNISLSALNDEVDRLAKAKYGQNIEYMKEDPMLYLVDEHPYIKVSVSPQNYKYDELYDFIIPLM